MVSTRPASLSIRITDIGRHGNPDGDWAQIDLEDFFWLGRCWICNLQIGRDQCVSRLHATIERYGDGYRLTDMQSHNGTMVNGRYVRSCRLDPGDTIKLGETTLRFSPDRPDDTVFRQGTTRQTGQFHVSLRSFSSSIPFQVPRLDDEPRPLPPPSRPPEVPDQPGTAEPAGPVTGDAPTLETFLTIIADRIATEFRPRAVRVFVPATEGVAMVALSRGWRDGALDVRGDEPEAFARIEKALAHHDVPRTGDFPDLGSLVFWDAYQVQGVAPADGLERYKLPLRADGPWGFTVPLSRVGRLTPEAQAAFFGLAWIHVDLDPCDPHGAVDKLLEVAGGLCAAVSRFVDRARSC